MWIVLLLLAGAISPTSAEDLALTDSVRIDTGLLSGSVTRSGDRDVHIYRGIPYAAPPTGLLRWKPPQPAIPWKGVRSATQFGPAAAQAYRPGHRSLDVSESQMSEDCLYLNVNTAARSRHDKLPVMVWLHPGGLDSGSGNLPLFNGPALAGQGVVVVTVTHRLGALGLLAIPELAAESPENAAGNYGLLDLVMALQWVRRNITAFGGDPANVTIFGEGGGAQKALWLLASPLARGLFQRAIVESGTSRTIDDPNVRVDTEEQSYEVSQHFIARIGVGTLRELRAKRWQQIVDAMPDPPPGAEFTPTKDYRMHPTIDAWSLTDHPINILDEGLGSDVPVLAGGPAGADNLFFGYARDWLPALARRASPLYVYRFTHLPDAERHRDRRAPPGAELRYQFGDLAAAAPDNRAGGAPNVGRDEQAVMLTTLRIWTGFASNGDPSVPGLIQWPAFRANAGEDRYVDIGTVPSIQTGFLATFGSNRGSSERPP
jgi:para-nitrobenzyl esterase